MDAKRLIKSIIRRKSESKKTEDLSIVYNNIDQHLEQLKDYRVKIDF